VTPFRNHSPRLPVFPPLIAISWRRRESNPRSQQSASDPEEDPDLASADAAETASDLQHKVADSLPFIDPRQLSVFDLLDAPGDESVG
jgi:hypothetical protein